MEPYPFNPNLCIPPFFRKDVGEPGIIIYPPGAETGSVPPYAILSTDDWAGEMEKDDGLEKIYIWFKPISIKRKDDPDYKFDSSLKAFKIPLRRKGR